MKLLHTGDWHLGKIFHDTSLLEDQRHVLSQLLEELGKDNYGALLIAGDIYDRSIPPAEAVEVFSSFLAETKENFPELAVFIIPGNHDSAQRLAFVSSILRRQNIYITCNPEDAFTPIIISQKDEKVAFFLLPFMAPGSLQDKTSGRENKNRENGDFQDMPLFAGNSGESEGKALFSQAEMAEEAAGRFKKILGSAELKNMPSVLAAHCFIQGGQESSSERIFIGNAEKIAPRLFSDFSYTALGHLHKFQKVTGRMYYAGSPLAYAFDEAGSDKFFIKVDIKSKESGFPVDITPVKINPLRKVTRLRGEFRDFLHSPEYEQYSGDYLEMELTDKTVQINPMQILKSRFPYLLSIRQNFRDETETGAKIKTVENENANPVRNFEEFERFLYPSQEQDELNNKTELFSGIIKQCAQKETAGEHEA